MTDGTDSFARLVERLSAVSVKHRSEAYRNVAWDDPAHVIDREDPRWQLPAWDPIAASDWYRNQPSEVRSAIGLSRVVALLAVGVEFESVLQHGLLDYAATLPNDHPSFRYVYHEIAEEVQHTLMFREFVERSGVAIPTSSGDLRRLYDTITDGNRTGWVLVFVAAFAAEDVFDRLQRRMLDGGTCHPLFRRISEIHIAEEARHLTFARAFLRDAVPALDADEMRFVRFRVPLIVEWMTRHVLSPGLLTTMLASDWGAPDAVVREVESCDTAVAMRCESAAGVVDLCSELGLVDKGFAARLSALRWMTLSNDGAVE